MTTESDIFPNIRGLSLSRPWPWAFLHGDETVPAKRIENRSWRPPQGIKWLALHAAKSFDDHGWAYIQNRVGASGPLETRCVPIKSACPHSEIFAICQLESAYHIDGLKPANLDPRQRVWAFGPWCWVISEFVPLVNPVPAKGAMGLWKIAERPGLLEQLVHAYDESVAAQVVNA